MVMFGCGVLMLLWELSLLMLEIKIMSCRRAVFCFLEMLLRCLVCRLVLINILLFRLLTDIWR